ncbi:MAG: low affinity iron permease family protein [Rhodospirillaceae bacterium]
MKNVFSRAACKASYYASRPVAFITSCTVVIVWIVSGPLFNWGTTWQLLINTGTTIVTFLMIFLLQHAQAHDTTAMHLKLDEIIRAVKGAHNDAIDFEKMAEDELLAHQRYYYELAEQARKAAMGEASMARR